MKKRFLEKSLVLTVITMCLCVISISGCGRIESRGQADKLERTVTDYASALRWSYYREAVSYHVTRDGKYPDVDIEELEKIEVTDVNFISKTLIPSSEKDGVNEARIVAEVIYYNKDRGTLKEMQLDQIWWYNAEIKHWLIETDFPVFK
ncbi:MAG: hypothetical protein DRQ48_10045 [Gammaproteobacteria bacterium]|nr:MAG: hypothetical protein DRQ58_11125 [Gammaproteobacteria bacterium]RKZ67181.1 MAG: hypothetical protein DRQ48_10045 [Gammaproteobacteria bacterium]